MRRLTVQRLEAITDRDVSIAADFDLVPSLTPTLAAEGLVVANAPWGSRPAMLEAQRVEVELQLLPLLLRRDVLIDRLALIGADILVERGPDGQVNWVFDPAAPEAAQTDRHILVSEVSIEDSRVIWRDTTSERSETVGIGQLIWQADSATDDLALSGAGEFDEHPFTFAGELGSIATLRQGKEPYPIALELTVEDLDVALDGQLSPEREAQFDLRVAGESLASVADLHKRRLPALGAFALEGKLTGPPPSWRSPTSAAASARGPGSCSGGDRRPHRGRPRWPGHAALGAGGVLDAIEFTNASLNLTLLDGRLGLDDLVLRAGGGQVAGDVAVEAEAGAAEIMIRLSASDVAVGDLLRDFGATEKVMGEVDIDINIDSSGRSIDELMAELEGSAAIAAEEGRIEDNQLHRLVADLDVLTLPPFWRRERAMRVNCLIGEFDIEDGVAETGAMLDTQRMTLLGEGTVDLGKETFDVQLRPLPKTQKLSTLAIPVDIEGTFTEPEVRPHTETAVAQAARGVLGGLLIPLNQISALFGQQTTDACAAALRQAQERKEQRTTETQSRT